MAIRNTDPSRKQTVTSVEKVEEWFVVNYVDGYGVIDTSLIASTKKGYWMVNSKVSGSPVTGSVASWLESGINRKREESK